MNDAAGHFFYSRYSGLLKTPYWHFLRLLFLLATIFNSPLTLQSQDYRSLKKDADNYFEKEQYHSAAQYYQVAIGLEPDHAEDNYRLAESYRAIFNYSLAAVYYEKAQAVDVLAYPLAPFYLALMNKATGNFTLAIEQFEAFIANNQNNQMLSDEERKKYLVRANLEKEGCDWALLQMKQGWIEKGFNNLPQPVNSSYNDYAVAIGENDSSITITSGRRGVKGALLDNRYGDYFTDNLRFKKEASWEKFTDPDRFDNTNSKFNDGAGAYNATRDKYYFTSCYEGNAFCQLYVTTKQGDRWKAPKALNQNVNFPGYDNRHPTLTPTGDTLIFVSNRPGGVGGNDIWYSVSSGGDNWQPAQLAANTINTPFDEITPFYYPDGTLFFSSNGHIGMGGMDVYMVSNFHRASVVTNMNAPFNSGFDDTFFILGLQKGYISSNRGGGFGKFDIYSFNWPGTIQALADQFKGSTNGDQLRSRIRDYGNRNLFAARDEDQFYYDNLTAEERALIDRILAAKRKAEGNFDPTSLAPEDFKYYRKLDIETKAIIERLAQRRALEIPGSSVMVPTLVMDHLEQSDLAFYENASAEDRATIDRIIAAKIEDRKELLQNDLSPQQSQYWETQPTGAQERIENQGQLQTVDALLQDIVTTSEAARDKLTENQRVITSVNDPKLEEKIYQEIHTQLAARYQTTLSKLSMEHQVFYGNLTPQHQDDLRKLAIRQLIINETAITEEDKVALLSELDLPPVTATILNTYNPQEFSLAQEIITSFSTQVLNQEDNALTVDSKAAFEELTLKEQLILEIKAQQELLLASVRQITANRADLENIQGELREEMIPGVPENPQDRAIETQIAEQIARRSMNFVPRKLTPKEAYFFQSLAPRQQLILDRLARFVLASSATLPASSQDENLGNLSTLDRAYLESLPQGEKEQIQEIVVTKGQPTRSETQKYLSEFDPLQQKRIARMINDFHDSASPDSRNETPLADPTFDPFLDQLTTSDQQYYENLSRSEQGIIQAVITTGSTNPGDYPPEIQEFLERATLEERSQIENLVEQYDAYRNPVALNENSTAREPVDVKATEEVVLEEEFLQELGPEEVALWQNLPATDRQLVKGILEKGTPETTTYSPQERIFWDQLDPLQRQGIRKMIEAKHSQELSVTKTPVADTTPDSQWPPALQKVTSNEATTLLSNDEKRFLDELSESEQKLVADIISKGTTDPGRYEGASRQFLLNLPPAGLRQVQNISRNYQQRNPGNVPTLFSSDPVIVSGQLKDTQTNRFIASSQVTLMDTTGNIRAIATTDEAGYFKFDNVAFKQELVLALQDRNIEFQVLKWSIRNVDVPTEAINHDENNVVASTYGSSSIIYFDFDRFTLRSEAKKTIEELVSFVGQREELTVLISGHTDFVGPSTYNQRLSESRSKSAANYFQKLAPGLKSIIRGYGESQPQGSNQSRVGRQFNRRVELLLQGADGSYRATTRTVLVKPGVRLTTLASALSVSVNSLMTWNGLLEPSIRPYQPLRIPVDIAFSQYQDLVFDPLAEEQDYAGAQYHLVQYGETLFRLAQRYNTSVQQLEALNNLQARDLLAGKRIRVR